MVLFVSVRAWKILEKRRLESRSRSLLGEKLYAISLGVLPVVKKDILLNINCMQGSTSGQRKASSKA